MKHYNVIYDELLKQLKNYNIEILETTKTEQLRTCQAWIHTINVLNNATGEIMTGYLLQSYYTIAEIIIKPLNIKIKQKYSCTTSKQQTWFERYIGA